MRISQHQIQTQKQIMAPVMQQSIEVLLLPILELEQAIEQELEANPLLETEEFSSREHEAPDRDRETGGHETDRDFDDHEFEEHRPFRETISDEIQRLMNAPAHPYLGQESSSEDNSFDYPIGVIESLEQKLLRQLRIDINDPLKIHIGEMIIGQINEDGYLTTTIEEIAQALGLDTTEPVQEVLSMIQSYEPLGIASRNLQECLTIQINSLFNGNSALAVKIIENHLPALGRKRYDLIAKDLRIPQDHVRHCAQLISTLEPRPARNFRPICEANYIKPDLFIYTDPSRHKEYRLEVNEKGVPPLRINPVYRELLRKKKLSLNEKKFLKEKLQNALAFIKSVHQRSSTIREIGEYLLDKQKEFFENGHRALKPMRLKDVAAVLGRNESTISRAINQKYIDTPQGIFPLKYFFSQSVGEPLIGEDGVASRSVKEEIRELVESEEKKNPLSDSKIQQILKKQGIDVARRTINKYRKQLNILPSHLRKV